MKKFTVCLLIGAMAASMLTGCGSNGGSSDSSDSKADSSSETMTIMMNGSDSDAYMEGYRKIIDGFNESNDYGVKVEIQNVTNSDYKTKLTTMMASDSETDIIFTWELGYLENFVNGDKIVSLQKYLEEVLKNLAEKWDCSYRIVSLSQGYESSPDGEMLKILEEATLEILGKTKEEAEILPFVSMGSSDGRFLADLDTKVYGYSPVYAWDMTFDSAVTMVHGINERIHRDSVVFGSKVLTLAVCRAAQSGI